MSRPGYLAATAWALLAVAVSGCGLQDKASEVAREQLRNACDGALRAAEQSLVSQGGAGADVLAGELGEQMPSEYREFAGSIADRITREARDRNLDDALESGAPAQARHQWHDMAVDVCAEQLAQQAGNVVG